jgi:sugar lactone lactonase YvrE
MKTIHRICIVYFGFAAALSLGQTALPFQHPRDQIALQLGAIQMGYDVPFQLVGNPTSAQQATNALAMGRNVLAATADKPAVKVQGFVSSPGVDSDEFRNQLYRAVEAVVTSPAIGAIKGSVVLENGKKQKITATLTVPPTAYAIPVPFALESATSLDAQALGTEVDSLSGSVSELENQHGTLSTQVGSLSGDVTSVQSQTTALGTNVTALENQATALSSSITDIQKENLALKQLLMGLDIFTTVTTLAGNGEEGYMDGAGEEAQFNYPRTIAVDGSGNVYVGETAEMGYKIRKITPDGLVSTLFESEPSDSGEVRLGGIAADSDGNVYVTEGEYLWDEFSSYKINKVRKIAPGGDESTLIYSANSDLEGGDTFWRSIAVDASGNIYVNELLDNYNSDWDEDRVSFTIRKIPVSGEASTILELGIGHESYDNGQFYTADIAVDAIGNIYYSEIQLQQGVTYIKKIHKISASGAMTMLANVVLWRYDREFDSGSIAVDATGNVYVSNSSRHRILRITTGGMAATMAGYDAFGEGGFADGSGSEAMFQYPSGIAVDANGNVYVADTVNNRIRKISVMK